MVVKSAIEIYTGKIEVDDGVIEFKFRKPSIIDVQEFQASLIIGDVTAEDLQSGRYKIDVRRAAKVDLYLLAFAIIEINICPSWNKMVVDKRIEELEELAKNCGEVYETMLKQVKEKVSGLI